MECAQSCLFLAVGCYYYKMDKSALVTQKARVVTIVVVVGGPNELIEATRNAAAASVGALTIACDIGEAATQVAQNRPFAIVMNDDLYNFDTAEFNALAKDVNATIIPFPIEGPIHKKLELLLQQRISEAYKMWRRQ